MTRTKKQFYLWCVLSLMGILLACNLNSGQLFFYNQSAWSSPGITPTPVQPISLDLASINEGLDQLRSYRASLIVEFEGSRAGQPIQGRLESLTEVVRQPPALRHYLKVTKPITSLTLLSPGVSEFYRLGDKVYAKKGDNGYWFTFTDSAVAPGQLGFFELARLITLPPQVTQPPRPELLNGQKVQRYSFTAADLSDPTLVFEQAEGDLWLADPGPYLAQYVISATLRQATPNPTAHLIDQGRMKVRYTLADANSNIKITLPDQALTGPLTALPRPPDARIVSIFPAFIEYTSAITPAGAAQFYRDQLAAQQWTEQRAELYNEKGRLIFAKGNQTMTILITPADEKGRVQVLVELKTP